MIEGYKRNAVQLTKNFQLYEGECHGKDCCGHAVIVMPALWERLQDLRSRLGIPITLACGFRCAKHNEEIGGSEDSDHLRGEAADVIVPPEMATLEAAQHCIAVGFANVGYYPRRGIIHASVRQRGDKPTLWEGR